MGNRAKIAAALAILFTLCFGPAAAQQPEKTLQPLQTQEKPELKPLPEKKPAQTAPAVQKPAAAVIPGAVTKPTQPAASPPVTLPSKGTLEKIPLPFPVGTPSVKTPAGQPAAGTPGVTTVPGTQKTTGMTQATKCQPVQGVVQGVVQLKAKLGPYLRSTYDFINLGRQMKQAGLQARQAAWKTYPGSSTGQVGTGVTPATPGQMAGVTPVTPRQTTGVTAVTPRQSGEAELQNMQRIRGEAQRVHGNSLREAGEIRGVLSGLNGEIRKLGSCSSLSAQERQSLRASADSLNTDIATLKSYESALQAQSNEYASQLSAQQLPDPRSCGGCNRSACQSCCTEKCRVTGAPGSALRAQQEHCLAQCRAECQIQAAICSEASNQDRRSRDFWSTASDIRKSVTESQTSIIRTM
ncbi:MAG TPA: hypothetical protein PLQ15_00890 [Syntrophales bacterium]|nr:hypothetical protein [Syntrophales bacterium]